MSRYVTSYRPGHHANVDQNVVEGVFARKSSRFMTYHFADSFTQIGSALFNGFSYYQVSEQGSVRCLMLTFVA